MKIRGSVAKSLLIGLAVALIPVNAVSAQKISPGGACKVMGQKIAFQKKTYTCIKSGKKLVWNKGVALRKPTPTPTPTQTPSAPQTPTPPPAPESQILSLSGVQKMNLPTDYVGQTPSARILFRWPIPSIANLGGYVISYQDQSMFSPPCDLTNGLCEGPRMADDEVYNLVITDSQTDKVEIGGLKLDNSYQFKFCYVIGDVQAFQNIGSLCWSQGFRIYLYTDTEKVPKAPAIAVVGLSKAIEVDLQSQVPNGFRVKVLIFGGQFGMGATAASLASTGKMKIDASPGLYEVVAIMVTPSGINGDPSSSFRVNVSP